MEESKSPSRVAFTLLCALAVCCSVMYITSDGSNEVALEDAAAPVDAPHETGSGQHTQLPSSIDSTDVLKTGLLFTRTPDTLKNGKEGRERLLDFLNKVEDNIEKERASRKADIESIRQQMAKNFALNEEARKKMKKVLLAKMAENAKKAKDDLAGEMRTVQKKFADAAALENKRQRKQFARSKKTREIMKKNKKEGAKSLKNAVAAQQRSLAALDSATNAKIKQTNKRIHENAAQIKTNAKKARADLDSAMNAFDNKMNNIGEEAKKGRSKLVAQAANQDKKYRKDANDEIKKQVESAGAQFSKVHAKMAKNRADADAALRATTSQMDAALEASNALQDKRFASTVKDIQAAKKEASDRVEGFRTKFKADILKLDGVVTEQTQAMKARQAQISGTVTSNKAAQADVNRHSYAEITRMMKLGQDRYDEHMKKDQELKTLMDKNKKDTQDKISKMKTDFISGLNDIKSQMKKDRAHAEEKLNKASSTLFSTLTANKKAQDAINDSLDDATHAAELKAKDELKAAKEEFVTKLGGLRQTVTDNEAKHSKKVEDLTGIVAANALKDKEGRDELKKVIDFNKAQVKIAVADAIHAGEQRALQVEKKMAGVNKKTVEQMNGRITTEISKLTNQIHGQIQDLTLQTKEARAQMKKEILFEVGEAKKLAAENLKAAVEWSESMFVGLYKALENEDKLGEKERAALNTSVENKKKEAAARLSNAVSAQAAALLTYKQEVCENIGVEIMTDDQKKNCGGGKTNKKLKSTYDRMIANAKAVKEEIKNNGDDLKNALEAAKAATEQQLGGAATASGKRYDNAVKAVEDGIDQATTSANKKFGDMYIKMGEDALHAENALLEDTKILNEKIAQMSALDDERFSKTVEDVSAARIEAAKAVEEATKNMKTRIFATREELKRVNSRVTGDIDAVSGMVISHSADQAIENKNIASEIERVEKEGNDFYTSDKRYRGALRKMVDEHKKEAAREVEALAKTINKQVLKVESEQEEVLIGFKKDLTSATSKLYKQLGDNNVLIQQAQDGMTEELKMQTAKVAQSLADAQDLFNSRAISLTNVITANAKSFTDGIAEISGTVTNWKEAADSDRQAMRNIRAAASSKMHKDIVKAIQIGEAMAKKVELEGWTSIESGKKKMLSTIMEQVENMADNVFATVQGNRKAIADNYLSLKAYAAAANDKVIDYLQKGKGRNLSSVGDLLRTLGDLDQSPTKAGEGAGFGADKIEPLFNGDSIDVDGTVSKINGLVNEYIGALGGVKGRWPMGIGKYLIGRLEIAMQDQGALEVDTVDGREGNFVYLNSATIGLASRLADLQTLAVTMQEYEAALSKLTTEVSKATQLSANKKDIFKVPPPEWNGQ